MQLRKALNAAVRRLRSIPWRKREPSFFGQKLVPIRCGAFEIMAPENHILISLMCTQPYRDQCVGVTARFVSEKYPTGTFVDIGANIGDTAAIMASNAANRLILVEASEYFFEILSRNSARLPNEIVLMKTLVSDGSDSIGSFQYWGGTATFKEAPSGERLPSRRLEEIADASTCFVKVDTDGYDFRILGDSLPWLAGVRPAVLFEHQVHCERDHFDAERLYTQMISIGYRHFVVWDDAGFHLLSTGSLDALRDLNHYLFQVTRNEGRKSIYNYDVLALHSRDADLSEKVHAWYRAR